MFKNYKVDVNQPAPKMAEIDAIIAANTSSVAFNAVCFLSMFGVIAIAACAGNIKFEIAIVAFSVVLMIFLLTGFVNDLRKGILKRLRPIEGMECAEMVHFLKTAESPDVLRYVAEVRKMGRRFTHLEFSELQAFEDRAMAKIREAKAVEALYGVQAEKGL